MTENGKIAINRYLAAYRDAIAHAGYGDLTALQQPPFATLALGGTGTAVALARLGNDAAAARWAASIAADRRRRAYDGIGYFSGRAGAELILARRTRAARRLIGGPREVFAGTAGALIGASLALRSRDDSAMQRLAEALADDIRGAVRRRARAPWRDRDAIGFAHGWSGQIYALLLHGEVTRTPVEAWFVDALARLARAWRPARATHASLRSSWCGGDAGAAIVWCKAFERTGDARFRRAAIAAARAAMRNEPDKTHICCGKGAIAYALLAIQRIDRGNGWRDRALAIGARAIAAPLVSRWPNGLLRGHPGLVCLALDLLSDAPRGFPCIEG